MADLSEENRYTDDELSEIERILSELPGGAPLKRDRAEAVQDITEMVEVEDLGDEDSGFSVFDTDDTDSGFGGFESGGEDTLGGFDAGFDAGSAEAESETPSGDAFPAFDTDFGGGGEAAEPDAGFGDLGDLGDFGAGFDSGDSGFPGAESDAAQTGDFTIEEPAPEKTGAFNALRDRIKSKFTRKTDASSTEGQLESLLADEPESVDDQDISRDAYTEEPSLSDESFEEPSASFDEAFEAPGETGDLAADGDSFDFGGFEAASEAEPSGLGDLGGISLEGSADFSGPDLSDLSIADSGDVQEASIDDIPEMDFGSAFGDESDTGSAVGTPAVSFDLDEAESDLGTSLPHIDHIEEIDTVVDSAGPRGYIPAPEAEALDLSVHELKKLKNALRLMPLPLMKAVKDAVLNDALPKDDTAQLVNMVLDGAAEDDIRTFLEEKLRVPIDTTDTGGRRRIYARDEYTQEGRERQRILLRRTRNIGVSALVVAVLGVLGYQYLYKPWMAKRLIDQGVALIRQKTDPKTEDYLKAEELFRRVEESYVQDYLYGYARYGRAYFEMKEWDRSLDKLNKGYKIAERDNFPDITILNELGYFYSKVPPRIFAEIKPHLKKYYWEKIKPIGAVDTQLNVAIDFYRKANNKNPKDVTSLYGIGNAYFYQGQYQKARQFFEDIIKIDPDSVVGHSGLLNLFIERDDFPQTIQLYVKLRDKDIMPEFPSALLAKFAGYVLSKKADEDSNIRIDYGIQSPRLKDQEDNPYPVVMGILKALKERDPEYPPLYLMYAKMAMQQKNHRLAEDYLFKAIDAADANNEEYFGALHLLGEYYYLTKDPVKSYKYLRAAERAYLLPAEFAYEEFYRETEEIGRTYALQGNLFYYFFDKVKLDTADQNTLDDTDVSRLEDRMENYSIARGKYEKALAAGWKSPELHYNLGRIYYMNRSYEEALAQWLNLYDDFTRSPELMFSLGNAFLKLNNLDSAKAQYTKLIAVFELDAEAIRQVNPLASKHVRIFETLAGAYNNLGTVYQLQGDEAKGNLAYWKSVEYATKLGTESEFARVNLARTFKGRQDGATPLVNDNIPYSLEIYREDMRL